MAKKEIQVERLQKQKKESKRANRTKVISREELRNMIKESQKIRMNNHLQAEKQQVLEAPKVMNKEEFKSVMEVSERYDCPICL